MRRPLRKTVILAAASVSVFYLVYRAGFTLNLTTTYATTASLLLLIGEAFGILSILLYFIQIWDPTEPPMRPVLPGRTVDVFVPTYNEDLMILRATLEACGRLDYPHRTYLCDDGGTDQRCNDANAEKAKAAQERRAALQALCAELGANYITRPANVHAKAGNLNEAFVKTDGEFIIIFDADHVPEKHFITRLIGYFEDPKLGYVQTPHAFYNFDSFQARLDHKKRRYWEEGALFYGLIQPGRNRWNCPIFAGSAAMFRRTAMAEVGYIATETITEDMHTGMRLNAKGWKSLGISERMVAGQAAPDITTFHTQRLRWGEGNLSIMAHDFPLTMKGLTWGQRLSYLGSMVHWAGGFFKLLIYVSPILMMLSGVPPVSALTWELAAITTVYLLASVWGVYYVSNGYGSLLCGELFCMVNFWTQIRATCRALFLRKFQSFVVTSKRGRQSKSVWPFVRPHLLLGILSFVALSWGWSRVIFGVSDDILKPVFPTFWIVFHLWLIVMVVSRAMWPEDRRFSYRHAVNLYVDFESANESTPVPAGAGVTVDLSESGIGFMAYDELPQGAPVRLRVRGGYETIDVTATIVWRKAIATGTPGKTFTGYRYGAKFAAVPVLTTDAINRVTLQYAVPRLYQEYALGNNRSAEKKVAEWLALRLSDRREEPRKPYHLPIRLQFANGDEQYGVTEDLSKSATAVLLDRDLEPGADVAFKTDSPLGALAGTAKVHSIRPHPIGNHTYHRAVLKFASWCDVSEKKLHELIGYRSTSAVRDVITPEKKKLKVPVAKPATAAALAITLLIGVQMGTFPMLYSDELFLHQMMTAQEPPSPEDIERYERIYAATMAQSYPSNDRLVLLMGCLPRLNNFEGRDELTRFLAARDRNNIDLQLALAGSLDKAQDYSRAEAEFRRLLELDRKGRLPESRRRDLLLASARSAVHRGDTDSAVERFETFLNTYPDQGTVRNEYAGVMIQAGRYKDVPRVFANSQPDYDGHVLLMSAYALDKDFDKAEEESRALLQLRPNDPKAGRLLADLLTYRKNYQQSKDLYERLLKENQNDPDIRMKLGQIHLANSHFDDAVVQFQTILDRGLKNPEAVKGFLDAAASAPRLTEHNKETARRLVGVLQADPKADPVYMARLCWVLERSNEGLRGIELVQRALQLRPDDKDIKKQYFGLLVGQGRMTEALGVLGADRSDPSVRRLLVDVFLRAGDFAMATTELRALTEAQPDDLKLRRLLADVLSWKKDYAASLAAFERLRQANPGDETIPVRIAEVTHWSGDAIGALTKFETLLAAKFERPDLWRGYVDAAAEAPGITPAQFRLAVRISEQPATRESINVPFMARLAWIFVREKQLDYAAPLLDRAQTLAPDAPARKELAGVLSAAGRHKEALVLLEELPIEGDDRLRLANIYAALKEHDAAEKECREYLKEKPSAPTAERLLADVLSWKKDYAGSLTLFRKLQRLYPEDDELPVRIAEVTLWSGNHVDAFAQFEEFLKKRPGDQRIANAYIECCAAAQKLSASQVDQVARLLATKAFEPKDAAAQARLAEIYFKAGDKAESEKRLAAALALKPVDADTRKQIGVLLLTMRRPNEALAWFEGLTPDFEDRLTLAHAYAAANRFDQAEVHVREALRLRPAQPRAERLLADVLSWKGDHKGALALFAPLRLKAPHDVELATRVAEVTLWSGDAAAALWLLQDLLDKKFEQPRLWPAFVDAAAATPKLTAAQFQLAGRIFDATRNDAGLEPAFLTRLAWVIYQTGRRADAAMLIDRALERRPADPKLRRELAGVCGLVGKAPQAMKLYEGLELTDDDREKLVGLYAALKDYLAAEQAVRQLLAARKDDPKLKQLLADVLSWKGDHQAALTIYRELLVANPNDEALDIRLAALLHAAGDSATALSKYEARLTLNFERPELWPAFVDAAAAVANLAPAQAQLVRRIAAAPMTASSSDAVYLGRLALVLTRLKDPLAKALLDRIVKIDPQEPDARRELAGIFTAAGRPDNALAYYKGLDLTDDGLLALSGVLASLRDFPSALKVCRDYLNAHPGEPKGERLLADLLSWSGAHDEALAIFERLRRAKPDDLSLAVRIAETTLWAGRPDEALDRFAAVLERDPVNGAALSGFVNAAFDAVKLTEQHKARFDRLASDVAPTSSDPVLVARTAVVLLRLGRATETDRLVERAMALSPAGGPVRRQLGGLMALAGKDGRASLLWSGLPFVAEEVLDLARLFAAGRNYKLALRECNAVLARNPENPTALRLQADLLAADKQHPLALALLKKLHVATPNDPLLPIRIAEVTLASGDTATALDLFQKELERDPGRQRLWAGFVDAAAAARNLTAAQKAFVVQSFEKTTLRDSNDPAFLTRFAWLLHMAERSADAAQLVERAVAKNPIDPTVRKNLGGVCLALGKDKLAAQMYEGLQLDSADQLQMINVHNSKKDFTAAEKQARALLAKNPGDPKLLRMLADILSWKGEYKAALDTFATLQTANGNDPEVQTRIAEVKLWSGDAVGAAEDFAALLDGRFDQPRLWTSFIDAAAGVKTPSPRYVALAERINQSLTANNKDPLLLARLALILHRGGKATIAAQLAAKALLARPQDPAARRELAGLLSAIGNHRQALELFDGLTLTAEDRIMRIGLFAGMNDLSSAEREARDLVAVTNQDPKALKQLAEVLTWRKELKAAAEVYARVAAVMPNDPELAIRAAEIAAWSGNYDAAAARFEAILTKDVRQPKLWPVFVATLANVAEITPSQQLLAEKIIADSTLKDVVDVSYLSNLSWVLHRIDKKAEAEAFLDRALAQKPTEPGQRKILAGVLEVFGRNQEALQMFEGLVLDVGDRLQLAGLYSAGKQYDLAERQIRSALGQDPKNLKAARMLADVLSWKGKHAESLAEFAKLAVALPDDESIPVRVAEVTLWSRDYRRATELYQALLDADFERPLLWPGFIDAAASSPKLKLQNGKTAMAIFDRIAKNAQPLTVWCRLAWVVGQFGDKERQKLALDKALATNPEEPAAKKELAAALCAGQRHKEALALYDGLELDTSDYLRLAAIHAALKNQEAADEYIRLAQRNKPRDFDTLHLMADVLSWSKHYKEAIQIYEELLIKNPEHPNLVVKLANVLLWSGNFDDSAWYFANQLSKDFDQPTLWGPFLDATAASRSLDMKVYRPYVDKIHERLMTDKSPDPDLLNRLGGALTKAGEHEKGLGLLREALKAKPNSREIRTRLAQALSEAGRYGEAEQLYRGLLAER